MQISSPLCAIDFPGGDVLGQPYVDLVSPLREISASQQYVLGTALAELGAWIPLPASHFFLMQSFATGMGSRLAREPRRDENTRADLEKRSSTWGQGLLNYFSSDR